MFETLAADRADGQGQRPADRFYGKYPGLVLANEPREDEQENPDGIHLGELCVEVPGILEETPDGEGEQPIQVWARPCFHPGFFFIPEVGAQVWVEFLAGDVNSPVWTGVWYPVAATPQTVAAEPPNRFQKVIRTASGHVVQLEDTEDGEKIVITHHGGAVIQIDAEGSVLLANQNGSFVSLDAAAGELTLGEEHGNLVTLTNDGVLVANKESKVTLEMKDDKLTILAQAVDIMASKINLHQGSISLGGATAVEPVPLGQQLLISFNAHTHATAMGPSGPPLPPLMPTALSQTVKVKP